MFQTPPELSVDDYMARLARELKSLPAAVRDEHLRELRQHVEQLIAARAGQPDAVQSALLQMGDPVQVGQKLLREWQNNSRAFWRTVLIVGTCQLMAQGVLGYVSMWIAETQLIAHHVHKFIYIWPYLLMSILPFVAGTVTGLRLPNRAIAAALVVSLVASLSSFTPIIYHIFHNDSGMVLPSLGVSFSELLAAYVASSVKRRDWTLRLQ